MRRPLKFENPPTPENKRQDQKNWRNLASQSEYDALFDAEAKHPKPLGSVWHIRLYWCINLLLLGLPWLIGFRLAKVNVNESGIIQDRTTKAIYNAHYQDQLYQNLQPGTYLLGPNDGFKKDFALIPSGTQGGLGRIYQGNSAIMGIKNMSRNNLLIPLGPNQSYCHKNHVDYEVVESQDVVQKINLRNQVIVEMAVEPGIYTPTPDTTYQNSSIQIPTSSIGVCFNSAGAPSLDGVYSISWENQHPKTANASAHIAHIQGRFVTYAQDASVIEPSPQQNRHRSKSH